MFPCSPFPAGLKETGPSVQSTLLDYCLYFTGLLSSSQESYREYRRVFSLLYWIPVL